MTTYYLLIVADAIVDDSSTYYKVSVGQTNNDTKALQKLLFLAKANSWFFQKFDLETTLFFGKIALSLGKKVWQLPLHQEHIVTLLAQLCSAHKRCSDHPTKGNMAHLRFFIDTNFRIKQKTSVLRKAEAIKRKKPKVLVNTPSSMGASLIISI